MRKLKLILALVSLVALSSAAENLKDALKVTFTDDTTPVTVILDDAPELTYNETSVIISASETSETSYTFESIKDITFVKVDVDQSGIADINDSSLAIYRTPTSFILSGLSESTLVNVYTISGQLAASGTADANGTWTWETTSFARGVYIISIGDKSVKVVF